MIALTTVLILRRLAERGTQCVDPVYLINICPASALVIPRLYRLSGRRPWPCHCRSGGAAPWLESGIPARAKASQKISVCGLALPG